MHTHLAGDVAKNNVTVFQLYSKRRVGQVLHNLTLHLDNVLLRHALSGRVTPHP